jgi:hypothetical protein
MQAIAKHLQLLDWITLRCSAEHRRQLKATQSKRRQHRNLRPASPAEDQEAGEEEGNGAGGGGKKGAQEEGDRGQDEEGET